jgi:hypothetical protein
MRGGETITDPAGQGDTSRRSFLRRAGLMSAAAAAFVGGADVLGLTPASAATRSGARNNCVCPASCTYVACGCRGAFHAASNGCCDSGWCCYHCNQPTRCGGGYHACLSRSWTHCAPSFAYCN